MGTRAHLACFGAFSFSARVLLGKTDGAYPTRCPAPLAYPTRSRAQVGRVGRDTGWGTAAATRSRPNRNAALIDSAHRPVGLRPCHSADVLVDHWPLVDLRIHTGRLELRLPDDEELALLAELAAGGVHGPGEHPYLTPWTDLPPSERALYVLQQHWACQGSWRVDDWALELGVFHDRVPIGLVTLRACNFPVLREVRTGSWLGLAHQGRGFGTEARAALLDLAFAGLDAVAATSEVFQDNAASQGVSRKLGYGPDGISRDVLHGRAVISDRLRITAQDWRDRSRPLIATTGLPPCLPLFGC